LPHHPPTVHEGGCFTADAPATQYRLEGGIYRNTGRPTDQGEGVVRIKSLAEFLLRIPDIEDNGMFRRVLHFGYQWVKIKCAQGCELHPTVLKLLELLPDLRFESHGMIRRPGNDQYLFRIRI